MRFHSLNKFYPTIIKLELVSVNSERSNLCVSTVYSHPMLDGIQIGFMFSSVIAGWNLQNTSVNTSPREPG